MTDPDDTDLDPDTPHSARVWNYWLGGKDNYEADRLAGDLFVQIQPTIITIAREGRGFIARTTAFLAGEAGIRQFLDVGTGLPTMDNTHEVAQRIAPDARVVYVDNDPLVLAHARVLLNSTEEGTTRYLHEDMRNPEALLAGAAKILDLTRPVAVLFHGVLGHIPVLADAQRLVRTLMDAVAPGSYLAQWDGTDVVDPATRQAQDEYHDTGATVYVLRTPEELESLFDGLEFVPPGFVSIPFWRPAEVSGVPRLGRQEPEVLDAFGGVARKIR